MGKYGLIGQRISNSLSPHIHKAIFERLQLDATYELFELNDFDSDIQHLLSSQYDGYNVTIPFKQSIIPFLNELDPSALMAGAVNTIKKEAAGWVGYNTDGDGFIASLKGKVKVDHRILLMGTGGASFGIASSLLAKGYNLLTCVGRSQKGIEPLVCHLKKNFDMELNTLVYSEVKLQDYDVIINATSVGMQGSEQAFLMDFSSLTPDHLVVDIVYKPSVTPLLKIADEKGARTIGGIHMLCAQALAAESIWQGDHYDYGNFEDLLLEVTKAVGL
jgi:shikimate dehydrogenase